MRQAVVFVPILFAILWLSNVHVGMAADHIPLRLGYALPAAPVGVDALHRTRISPPGWRSPGGPAPLSLSLDAFPRESSRGVEDHGLLPDADDIEENGDDTHDALKRDWGGLGRDTAFFLGYQGVVAGVLYLLPESVTKWTAEQRKTSMSQWWENVQHPQWDEDNWYVNYLGHPYFGAIAYVRARERRFGAFGGFWYAALLSTLYEFGIEALFERPSYQDLLVTPVAGLILGAFLFEPIRERVQRKSEQQWYDHLTLAVTDPLGTANSMFEKSTGIDATMRVQFRPPTLALLAPLNEPTTRSLERPQERQRQSFGVGIEFVFKGKKRPAPSIR